MSQTQPARAPERDPDPVDWALADGSRGASPGGIRCRRRISPVAPLRFHERHPGGGRSRDDTGLHAPGTAVAEVLDRGQWIDANVASMRRLLAPLTVRVGERMAKSPIAPVGRRIAGTELGVLLGFMAQRVLGQYDLLVPDDAEPPTAEVGRGLLRRAQHHGLEKRYAFRPRTSGSGSRSTRSRTARSSPVSRGCAYFLSLVEQALAIVDADPGG